MAIHNSNKKVGYSWFLYLYVFSLVIYYILNIAFPTDFSIDAENTNRIYPQIAGILVTFFSILIIIPNVNVLMKNKIMFLFLVLLCLSLMYVCYPFTIMSNISFIIRSNMGIIVMFSFYIFMRKPNCQGETKKAIYLLLLFQIIFCITTLVSDKLATYSTTLGELDSNAGFLLISCIPISLLLPNKHYRIYLYLFLVFACLYSGQRSAAASAMVSFPFCFAFLKDEIRKKDVIIILCAFIVVGIPVLIESISNIKLRNQIDLEKNDIGSGRLIFWGLIINSFFESDIFQIVFGHGTNSVSALLNEEYGLAIGAHNGWLDMLYSYGLVGFSIYLFLVLFLFKRNRILSNNVSGLRWFYLILFLIILVRASTSHGFFDISLIPYCTSIALAENELYRKRKIAR